MINEDDVNGQNLDVKTPSPLSSHSDQSVKGGDAGTKTGSSSAESSLSEFKKRIQELPSLCETGPISCLNPPNSRRTPRNRDAYTFYQNSVSCIEEKDEPEEKELSEVAPFKRNNARTRRRAKIHLQLETNNNTTSETNSPISCETSRNYGVDLKSPSSLNFGKSPELDTMAQSMPSAKSYPDRYLDGSSDGSCSAYRLSSLSADNREYTVQKDASALHGGLSLPLMCLPSERVEIRPLPPLPLSKTPPTKFGGYRPLRSVVLRNLSSGSDTESNRSSRDSTHCRLGRVARIGFPSFDSIEKVSPILSKRPEHLLLSPLTSSRLTTTPRTDVDQRLPESRKERIERVVSSIITARSAHTHDENFLFTNLASARKVKHRKLELSSNASTVDLSEFPEARKLSARTRPELPALSARSNICDYGRTVESTFHESSFRHLSKPLSTDIVLPCTADKPIKTVFQEERIEREVREDAQVKKAPLTEQPEKESIDALRATHSETLLDAANYIETTVSCRLSQEQLRDKKNQTATWTTVNDTERIETNLKDVDLIKMHSKNEDVTVPSLPLTSHDISNSTTPTNRTYTQSKFLDTTALITALSNVSVRPGTEQVERESNNTSGDSCHIGQMMSLATSSESNTTEKRYVEIQVARSISRKSFTSVDKGRSKIPVRMTSVKSVKSTLSPVASKYINDGNRCYSATNIYGIMSVDSNSETLPNATAIIGEFSFEDESKYRQQESEMEHTTHLPEKDDSGGDSAVCDKQTTDLACFPNSRGRSKQSTARHTENTSQCYSDSGSSFGKMRPSCPYTHAQALESGSDNSRYRFKLETANLSFRSKSDYSKCSDESRSEDKYQRSLKSDDYESGDAYDDETTVRSDLTDSRGPLLSHENLLRFNDEECMRLNLSAVREMSSIEELSEKTALYDQVDSKIESSDSVTVPSHEVCSSHYKSTQVPSWHSELQENFRCTENGRCSSDEESGNSSKVEDEIEDTLRSGYKSEISKDCMPDVRKKLKLDQEAFNPSSPANEKSDQVTHNVNKLQFSIERLAAEKFRRSISLEHTTASNEDNSPLRRYDNRPYALQCSASTSKLSCNFNTMKKLRSQKRSQDRFPFTISEKTSAVSSQMKAAPESRHLTNMNEKAKSLEKVYKLALHPSITRLAGGGLEDSVTEIMHCIAYNHEEEKRGRQFGMRGLVQKVSAKFKRAKKANDRCKVPFAETNILYQNQTYQGDSDLNSCSESSLLKELKSFENASTDGRASSPDKLSPVICEQVLPKARDQTNVPLGSPTPKHHDFDGQWVESLSDTARNQQSSLIFRQTTDTILENSKQVIKDICPVFFVEAVTGMPESRVPCLLDEGKPNEPSKKEQFPKTMLSIAEQSTPNRSSPHSKKNNRTKHTSKLDNNSDSETDCLCLKLCHSIPRICRRSRKKYPSSIKCWGYR